MPKGGARLSSGPVSDPNALRGAKGRSDWLHLPAAGRSGPTPPWPLTGASAREKRIWEAEWQRPQAIVWERNGQADEVAIYVRTRIAAEKPDATAALRTLLRQQQDSLGLTLIAMMRLRWIIDQEPESVAPRAPSEPGDVVDIRSRMRDAGGAP